MGLTTAKEKDRPPCLAMLASFLLRLCVVAPLFSSCLLLYVQAAAGGTVHVDGFIAEVVTTVKAMSGTFAPNPRNGGRPMMIVNSKNGQIHVIENPDDDSPGSLLVLDINRHLCTNGERGLHTVIAHPDFGRTNLFLYAFYTKFREECLEDATDGPVNVVDRFTMDASSLMVDYGSRVEIWSSGPMYKRLHNGGAMVFGNEQPRPLLYITTGDAGERDWSQSLTTIHGKIIRLNDDGTIPPSNPYSVANGFPNSIRCADFGGFVPSDSPSDSICGEIFASGLRNPFRIAKNPNVRDNKTEFSIGDVGAQHMESLYSGGTDYIGANYGWPMYEGVCRPADFNSCRATTATSPIDVNLVKPFHWYQHVSTDSTGGCIAGQATVPDGIWPEQYKYLFIDFIFLKIYNLELNRLDQADPDSAPPYPPTRNETFYTSIQKDGENVNEARMTSLFFGPYKDTQALYVTKFGNKETILRIRYNGIMNKPPKPHFSFFIAQSDPTGYTVDFDGSASIDPEGDPLTFEWNFGDGNDSTGVQTTHRFSTPGEYSVLLAVTDSQGQRQQMYKTVKIGVPPRVDIITPISGQYFEVGQVLKLRGEAIDQSGNIIADHNFVWEVRQHHADHFHPFLEPATGNNLDLFPAPTPEDFWAATNSFLRVILTVSDSFGVSSTSVRDVFPRTINVNMGTRPSGMKVVVDDYIVDTPMAMTSWYNFDLPLRVEDQPPYFFKSWSDGDTSAERHFKLLSNMTDPTIEAIFCLDLWMECEGDDDCCSGICNGTNYCSASPPLSSSSDEDFEVNNLGILISGLICGVLAIVAGTMWIFRRHFQNSRKQSSTRMVSRHGPSTSFGHNATSDSPDLEKIASIQFTSGHEPDATSSSTDMSIASSENSVKRTKDVPIQSPNHIVPAGSDESAFDVIQAPGIGCTGSQDSWFQSQAEHWLEIFMKNTGCTG